MVDGNGLLIHRGEIPVTGSIPVACAYFSELWCNGNTNGFGPFISRSNRDSSTNFIAGLV